MRGRRPWSERRRGRGVPGTFSGSVQTAGLLAGAACQPGELLASLPSLVLLTMVVEVRIKLLGSLHLRF